VNRVIAELYENSCTTTSGDQRFPAPELDDSDVTLYVGVLISVRGSSGEKWDAK
jgi:hypothetical protein